VRPSSRKVYRAASLAAVVLLTFVTSARAAGLLLYETGAPDLGTASAGRAAMAADASTAAANPAGMTLLDRSQLLGASGALLPSNNFDVAPQTTTAGGGGGNAGVFMPIGGFFYVLQAFGTRSARRRCYLRFRRKLQLRKDMDGTVLRDAGATHHR